MKRCLGLVCAVWMLLAGTAWAQTAGNQEADQEALTAALRCYEAMNSGQLVEVMLEYTLEQVPPEHRQEVAAHFSAFMEQVYKPALADLMVQHYSVEELTALAEFYESDMGRSIADKSVPFTLDTMQLNEQLIAQMTASLLEAHPELMEQ